MSFPRPMPRVSQPEPLRWFVAFMLPEALQTQAEAVIADLSDRYSTRTAYAPPHITLRSPFEHPPNAIGDIEKALTTFATTQNPVPITLQNFSAFPPRVLFIDVAKTHELLSLQSDLNQYLTQTCDLPPDKHRSFKPHVTVASRKMTKPKFQEMWAELQQREFSGEFVAEGLMLLRYENRRWHLHREFALGPDH